MAKNGCGMDVLWDDGSPLLLWLTFSMGEYDINQDLIILLMTLMENGELSHNSFCCDLIKASEL